MRKPARVSGRRPAVPCHACYRPIPAADRRDLDAGQYCAACRSSGAARRHLEAATR